MVSIIEEGKRRRKEEDALLSLCRPQAARPPYSRPLPRSPRPLPPAREELPDWNEVLPPWDRYIEAFSSGPPTLRPSAVTLQSPTLPALRHATTRPVAFAPLSRPGGPGAACGGGGGRGAPAAGAGAGELHRASRARRRDAPWPPPRPRACFRVALPPGYCGHPARPPPLSPAPAPPPAGRPAPALQPRPVKTFSLVGSPKISTTHAAGSAAQAGG